MEAILMLVSIKAAIFSIALVCSVWTLIQFTNSRRDSDIEDLIFYGILFAVSFLSLINIVWGLV